jgi:hypothetical protein
MNRSTATLLIAMALAVYGLYIASYVPALLIGPSVPALVIGFVLEAVCALGAAIGVWRGKRWATAVLTLLGASIAGTWLFEAFILGIVAYLRALVVAGIAVVITLLLAAYIKRQGAILKN